MATQGLRALDHTAKAGSVGVGPWLELNSMEAVLPEKKTSTDHLYKLQYISYLDFKAGHHMAV